MKFKFIPQGNVSENQDICRCLTNILSIPAGTIPLARGLGISWANLSKIPADIENDVATEIIEKVEQYEPRVAVSEVTFDYDDKGDLIANIIIERGDEDEYG